MCFLQTRQFHRTIQARNWDTNNDALPPSDLQTSPEFPNWPNHALDSKRVESQHTFCSHASLASSIFSGFYDLDPLLHPSWSRHGASVLAVPQDWNDPLIYPHHQLLHFFKSSLRKCLLCEAFLDSTENLCTLAGISYLPSLEHFLIPSR